jgi:hypothetical protein
MKLEEQVVSLELAKKLKELGVEQNSYFVWEYYNDSCYAVKFIPFALVKPLPGGCEQYSAFTVAELGEMLPKSISIKTEDAVEKIFSHFRLKIKHFTILEKLIPVGVWSIDYICDTTSQERNWSFSSMLSKPIFDKKEADARAKMVIYLIENKLM